MVEPVFLLEGELLVQLQPAEILSLPSLAFYFEQIEGTLFFTFPLNLLL